MIKLVVDEEGSELADRLWREPCRAASTVLAYPEGRAALAAAHRAGRLTRASHRLAVDDFETLYRELVRLEVDENLTRVAGHHAEILALRGYDAVHLAAALELGEEVVVVTWDKDLRRAAESTGLAVAEIVDR